MHLLSLLLSLYMNRTCSLAPAAARTAPTIVHSAGAEWPTSIRIALCRLVSQDQSHLERLILLPLCSCWLQAPLCHCLNVPRRLASQDAATCGGAAIATASNSLLVYLCDCAFHLMMTLPPRAIGYAALLVWYRPRIASTRRGTRSRDRVYLRRLMCTPSPVCKPELVQGRQGRQLRGREAIQPGSHCC